MESGEGVVRPFRVRPGHAAMWVAMAGYAGIVYYMWTRFYPFSGGRGQGLFCAVPYAIFALCGMYVKSTARRWALVLYAGLTVFSSVLALADYIRSSWPCGNSLFPPLVFTHFAAFALFVLLPGRTAARAVVGQAKE